MNPEPPPFGDPTNIQRENAAAVKKGVTLGCAGCATVVVAGLLFFGAIIFAILYFMQSTEPAQLTLQAAQRSEVLKQELGEPISLRWVVFGNVKIVNDSGTANLSLSVSGPRGSADVSTVGTMERGTWTFSQMDAFPPSGGRVDLRPSLPLK